MKARPSNRVYIGEVLTSNRRRCDFITLLAEEPLLVRVEDRAYAVIMRTPGEEVFHAAGYCLGEGLVDSAADIKTIGYDQVADSNCVDVWLKPGRKARVRRLLQRRWFLSQTSCGVCGKRMLKDLMQSVSPLESDFEIKRRRVFDCLALLEREQELYRLTRTAHAALILDGNLEKVSFAEDVGRHNALDKAVGRSLLAGTLPRARMLVMSSRLSFELVQKAARARLPVLIGISRPTIMAVEMARRLGMTLAFPAGNKLLVACGPERIR